jgi:hypothetical protein
VQFNKGFDVLARRQRAAGRVNPQAFMASTKFTPLASWMVFIS